MHSSTQSSKWLIVIGIFKLAKVAMLVLLGVGLLRMFERGPDQALGPWLAWMHFDARGKLVHEGVGRLFALDPQKLAELGIGLFAYAAVFAVEGTGLLLKKTWAEYLTLVVTVSFLPLEILELVHHASAPKWIALLINVAVVAYLAARLVLRRRTPRASARRAELPLRPIAHSGIAGSSSSSASPSARLPATPRRERG